ncbi:RNF213 [Mytilus edulis]|uniref:RNF213 n=1 Tax=Mytilus edulis TaxID=6550 RepID=A0A8S3RS08_MYTED|nr:RNF213 [Mytilus edulis]
MLFSRMLFKILRGEHCSAVLIGNPKRFHSQDVLRLSGQQTTKIKDLSGPVEDIETEAQRQLKTLLDKQLRTQTTLKEQLAQSRKFTNSTLYEPTTDSVTGIIDLSDYKALEEQDSRVNELRLCGLSDDEIRLKLQTEDGNVTTKKPDNTSVNNKIVLGMVNQIPECDIIANRLSVDEIRRLPKFENYEEGSQNNVLYLKNLPNKISENELGSLFLRFQVSNTSPIKFRIMSGRMRGQAFVTFDSKCQSAFLDSVKLAPNIARNQALKENVFMMIVCIEMRIPMFLVGKPGSSKSLAKTIVADAMQGNAAQE